MNYQHQSVPENVLMNDHAEQVILVDEADRALSSLSGIYGLGERS